jgi:uncharacterized protein
VIAVFDTNVYIAAIVTEGICSRLLHRGRAGEFSLVACPFIIGELRRILSKKFRLSAGDVAEAMVPVTEAIGRIVEHDVKVTGVCRDADDDNILACALAARAGYLVTGDADLIVIGTYRGIRIVTPRDFELLFA